MNMPQVLIEDLILHVFCSLTVLRVANEKLVRFAPSLEIKLCPLLKTRRSILKSFDTSVWLLFFIVNYG